MCFFQDGARRWLPQPFHDRNYVTINSNLMILVSISRFLGAMDTLRTIIMMFMPHYVTEKCNLASKITANTSKWPQVRNY